MNNFETFFFNKIKLKVILQIKNINYNFCLHYSYYQVFIQIFRKKVLKIKQKQKKEEKLNLAKLFV